jgi:subtilisin family serine protease
MSDKIIKKILDLNTPIILIPTTQNEKMDTSPKYALDNIFKRRKKHRRRRRRKHHDHDDDHSHDDDHNHDDDHDHGNKDHDGIKAKSKLNDNNNDVKPKLYHHHHSGSDCSSSSDSDDYYHHHHYYDDYNPYYDYYYPYYLKAPKAEGDVVKGIANLKITQEKVAQSHDKYIITFKHNIDADTKISELEKTLGFKSKHTFKHSLHGCSATIDKSLMNQLLDDPDINYIEKDSVMKTTILEKLPLSDTQQLKALVPQWNQTITNTAPIDTDNFSTVHCYVVDTGILPSHTEFIQGQVYTDYNAITQSSKAQDDNGHGTAVASLIGGKTVGSAVKTLLHSIKVLDSTGSGYVSDIISGLNWIIQHKSATSRSVINMSLGGSTSVSLNTAIQNCLINNLTVVCASGNSGIDASTVSPANTVGIIAVSAYDSTKTKPSWSNFGPVVSTFAPGDSVKAAWGDSTTSYFLVSGTSFSSPIVSAMIVRYLKAMPSATQSQIVTFLNKCNIQNEIINPGANTPNIRMVWNATFINPC